MARSARRLLSRRGVDRPSLLARPGGEDPVVADPASAGLPALEGDLDPVLELERLPGPIERDRSPQLVDSLLLVPATEAQVGAVAERAAIGRDWLRVPRIRALRD